MGVEQRSCLYGLLGGGIRRNWIVRSRTQFQKGSGRQTKSGASRSTPLHDMSSWRSRCIWRLPPLFHLYRPDARVRAWSPRALERELPLLIQSGTPIVERNGRRRRIARGAGAELRHPLSVMGGQRPLVDVPSRVSAARNGAVVVRSSRSSPIFVYTLSPSSGSGSGWRLRASLTWRTRSATSRRRASRKRSAWIIVVREQSALSIDSPSSWTVVRTTTLSPRHESSGCCGILAHELVQACRPLVFSPSSPRHHLPPYLPLLFHFCLCFY